jgi:hypothetical protein
MQNTHSKIKKLEKWAGDIHKRTLGDEVALLVFPSHKIIVLKPVFSGNPVEDQLGGVKHSWDHYMCHVDLPYPSPPPHFYLSDMWGDLYGNNSSIHSVAVIRSCDTLVLMASSSSSSTSSPFFILP